MSKVEPYNTYNIGEFIVLQLTKDTKQKLLNTIEEDGVLDFSEFDEDDFKVVAEFSGVGVGEIV